MRAHQSDGDPSRLETFGFYRVEDSKTQAPLNKTNLDSLFICFRNLSLYFWLLLMFLVCVLLALFSFVQLLYMMFLSLTRLEEPSLNATEVPHLNSYSSYWLFIAWDIKYLFDIKWYKTVGTRLHLWRTLYKKPYQGPTWASTQEKTAKEMSATILLPIKYFISTSGEQRVGCNSLGALGE